MQLLRTQLQNEIDFSSENLASLRLEATCVNTDAQWVLSFRLRTPDGVFPLRSAPEFYLCTRQDDPAAEWILTRPITASPSSPRTYTLARNWISECINEHQHPEPTASSFMPSRLLELRNLNAPYDVRLASEFTHPVPYVALSYCWGGEQTQKTTKANLKEQQQGIAYDTLPRTLQDAIKVTANLGYKYIWIDCLCIIQDDDADKSFEISQMPLIYSQAIVTIAAGSASAAEQGFLLPRRESIDGEAFDLAFQTDDGRTGTVTAVWKFTSQYGHEPLHTRGWTLQERLLSTRVLEYASRQLRFICPLAKGHDYVDGWTLDPERNPGDKAIEQIASWYDLVAGYTQRSLGVPSDRPIAISGIASKLESLDSNQYNTYIAGLWASQFPGNLLWSVVPSGCGDDRRPDDARHPSWSWTAIDAKVSMHYTNLHPGPWYVEHTTVLGHDVELQDKGAPYSTVKSAVITIKGPLRRAVCKRGTFKEEQGIVLADEDESFVMGVPILDAAASDFPDHEAKWTVHLLEFCARQAVPPNYPEYIVGLVLKVEEPIGLRKRFSRLGVFHLYASPFNDGEDKSAKRQRMEVFQDCEKETVELV
ncbi:heterokaryon incompatibility protein-domain-containing protein [Paraphoma chrysanthemicola]|nr:heterokaryon incompatibility protein-domain-containing protein [Paraphoma chrysanthemicola]